MQPQEKLHVLFQNPPSRYRSAPFWSWNDRLMPEELTRQIEEMHAQGMGGFFMHSREGLETIYMGDEWMDGVEAAVKAACAQGMSAWIYDEDRWPSGAAGGLVTAEGDAYRAKGITIELVENLFVWDEQTVAVFRVQTSGRQIFACRPAETCGRIENRAGEQLLVFRLEVSASSEWFNEDAPSDNLNPDCAKAFLEITFEAYKKRFGAEFGHTIPGVFTDEPNISHRYCRFTDNRGFIPWTYGFDAYFQEKNGYDIIPLLPYVFLDGERSPKTRHDYWKTISVLFLEAYTKQLGEWCGRNNLCLTGHFLFENELGSSIKVGGSVMPHYLYQHVPGIDMLDEQTHEDMTVRQCTSVANQFGRKHVLSETYAATGWDFDFEGQKWMGDWQFVQGVNLRCQHLAYYSIKGCRKRDFPPAFSYNTSWWKYNFVVEDYFARLSLMLSEGVAVRNVLVLHPLSTAWSMLGSDLQNAGMWQWDSYAVAVNAYGERFNALLRLLMGEHFDFDLGDELILEQYARVEQEILYVNQSAYSTIVLPQINTLFASTARLLLAFMQGGGHVLALTPLPAMIDGQEDSAIDELLTHPNFFKARNAEELIHILKNTAVCKVRIQDANGGEQRQIFSMVRRCDEHDIVFLVNNDRTHGYEVNVCLGQDYAELWDALTGARTPVYGENGWIALTVSSAGSYLFVLPRKSEAKPLSPNRARCSMLMASLGPVCKFTRTQPNALTLDKCRYRIGDGAWSEETDVWRAQRDVREALGMRQVYYNGLPQRYKWIGAPHEKDGAPVSFLFSLTVQDVPQTPVWLVLEQSELYAVTLNGESVSKAADGYWLDRAFHTLRLPALRQGENSLQISCAYSNRMEFEDIYLTGDFGVTAQRQIATEPDTLHFGDWCMQGYFHYCGSIVYRFTVNYQGQQHVRLWLGEYSAVHVEVRVNGQTAGHIPWRAVNGVCLDGFLTPGENQIELEVMGSPRNLFGPFHQAQGKVVRTDWRAFRTQDGDYTPDYIVKPYGLFGQIHITCDEGE